MKELKLEKPKKEISGYVFEMCSFKVIHGHDDSLPFVGNLYANGIKIGEAMNDGWGGEAVFTRTKEKKNQKLVEEIESVLKQQSVFENDEKLKDVKYSFGFLCDLLANDMLHYNTMKKCKDKNFIFLSNIENMYVTIPKKNVGDFDKLCNEYEKKGYLYYIR